MTRSRAAPILALCTALAAADAAAVMALGMAARPGDPGWALCQTEFLGRAVTPAAVAVTYLDGEAGGAVTAGEVSGWFPGVDGAAVEVYALEHQDGSRRVSFELPRAKWAPWARAARGARGREVCDRVRAELSARGIGRPAETPAAEPAPAHDYEFIYARRPQLYRRIEWVGSLDHALDPDRFARLRDWLAKAPES